MLDRTITSAGFGGGSFRFPASASVGRDNRRARNHGPSLILDLARTGFAIVPAENNQGKEKRQSNCGCEWLMHIRRIIPTD